MKYTIVALILGLSAFAGAAHADVETWQFTGTITSVTQGFTPPPFAALGQTVTVDYTINTATPLSAVEAPYIYVFFSAITSQTVDGQTTSKPEDIDWDPGFLGDINMSFSGRSDGINFVSFNDQTTALPYAPDVAAALADIASGVGSDTVSLRYDFSGGSALATATSFTDLSAAPEPNSVLLLLPGLAFLGMTLRFRSAIDAMRRFCSLRRLNAGIPA